MAYFITFTTYSTWLHGRAPGSVDRAHNQVGTPVLTPDQERELSAKERMGEPHYLLDADRRAVVLQTLREVAAHRGWTLWAVHVRSNHVHVVVTAPARPEKVMADLKSYASRRLKERLAEEAERTRWTQHGSMLYLWTEEALAEKVQYVVSGQGEPMAVYDGRVRSGLSEPEA
jgi:REP element-mobilizing transposase RayT